MTPPTPATRLRRLALVGGLVNLALAGAKLAAGIAGNSYALIADAIESLADILGSAVIWAGFAYGSRPADDDHPYGHGRAESLAALAVSLLVFAAGAWILVEAVGEIRRPHKAPEWFTLPVLVAVIIIKESLARVVAREARRAGSSAGHADSGHHRSDALTSAAAFVGISVALLAGPGYEAADDWAAILASLVVMYNGLRLSRVPLDELLDRRHPHITDAAARIAASVPGVRKVHKVRARKAGPAYWLDMHVWVDGSTTVRDAHTLAHTAKDAVRKALPNVQDVLIHIEPDTPAP